MNRRTFIKTAAGAVAALLALRPAPRWSGGLHVGSQTRGPTYRGRTYYAAPDGNDTNDGTAPERAWKTLAHVGNLQPGDRVYLSGVFREDAP